MRVRAECVLALVAALPLLVTASVGHAAGFFLTDRGARALSRGGAYTVGADDLNAAWFNPALIGRAGRGVTTYVDVGVIHQSVSFERSLDAETASFYPGCCDRVSNEGPPLVDPSLMIGYSPEGARWAAALSMYGPYADMPSYPIDQAQRFSLVSMDSKLLNWQATVAWAFSDDVRVGVGFQARQFLLRQRQVISTYPGFLGGPEDPEWDSLIELDVADPIGPGAVVGLWVRPATGWELGASWQTPLAVDAEGDLRVSIAGHYLFSTTFLDGSRIRLQTDLPMVGRAGLRYVGGVTWDAEVDVVWENWSTHEDVLVTPLETIRFRSVPGIGDYHVRSFRVIEHWEDTLSVRIGGSLAPPAEWLAGVRVPGLKVSGGAFWESGAVPDSTFSVNLVDSDKVGIGLGAALDVSSAMRLDIAFSHVFLASRGVSTSERRQVNTLYPEGTDLRREGRTIVGNGRYESSFDTVAVSLSAGF